MFSDEVNVDHRITSDMLYELRECFLSQQWAKALQVLPSLSKVPYSPSETIWRVRTSCPEVIKLFSCSTEHEISSAHIRLKC